MTTSTLEDDLASFVIARNNGKEVLCKDGKKPKWHLNVEQMGGTPMEFDTRAEAETFASQHVDGEYVIEQC